MPIKEKRHVIVNVTFLIEADVDISMACITVLFFSWLFDVQGNILLASCCKEGDSMATDFVFFSCESVILMVAGAITLSSDTVREVFTVVTVSASGMVTFPVERLRTSGGRTSMRCWYTEESSFRAVDESSGPLHRLLWQTHTDRPDRRKHRDADAVTSGVQSKTASPPVTERLGHCE